jgi:hypothetical protein
MCDVINTGHAKPLILTEFGCPASTRDAQGNVVQLPNNAQAQAAWIQGNLEQMQANYESVQGFCGGGFLFEWTDEWWKGGGIPYEHDGSPAKAAFPGGYWDEEWFGINAIEVNNRSPQDPWNPGCPNPADILIPRAAVEVVKQVWSGG